MNFRCAAPMRLRRCDCKETSAYPSPEVESNHPLGLSNPERLALKPPIDGSKLEISGESIWPVNSRLASVPSGMAVQVKKGKALDALSLTPLIDVVFLLLIFFLVATQFAQDDEQLPIKLPSASHAVPMTVEPDELVVSIGENGAYRARGQQVDLKQLETIIGQAVADNPLRQTVILRGDRRVAFQSIVSVLDLLTRLKVPAYRITTDDAASDAGSAKVPGARSEDGMP